MTAPFCTDCGTGCTSVYGRDAGPGERDIADALVWSCPVCPASWCRHDPVTDQPIGTPAGPETRNARAVLIERQVGRLIAEALDASPNGRAIADALIQPACDGLFGPDTSQTWFLPSSPSQEIAS